jgi:hypothetical protein
VSCKEKALEMAEKLKMDAATIQKLQREIFDMCLADFKPDDEGVVQTYATPATQQAPLPSAAAAPFVLSGNAAYSPVSPPGQRRCLRPSPKQRHESLEQDLSQLFREWDVPTDGNCGFHVMKIIHEIHFPQKDRDKDYSHTSLRKEIVGIMREEAESIFIARAECDISGPFNIYVKDEMISEKGSVDAYCDKMVKTSVYCGLNEFATFVHWIGDDIRIFYHTTKLVGGTPEIIVLARETVRPTAREYHVLHKDGSDGKDGHFVYLNPIVVAVD